MSNPEPTRNYYAASFVVPSPHLVAVRSGSNSSSVIHSPQQERYCVALGVSVAYVEDIGSHEGAFHDEREKPLSGFCIRGCVHAPDRFVQRNLRTIAERFCSVGGRSGSAGARGEKRKCQSGADTHQ